MSARRKKLAGRSVGALYQEQGPFEAQAPAEEDRLDQERRRIWVARAEGYTAGVLAAEKVLEKSLASGVYVGLTALCVELHGLAARGEK